MHAGPLYSSLRSLGSGSAEILGGLRPRSGSFVEGLTNSYSVADGVSQNRENVLILSEGREISHTTCNDSTAVVVL